MCSIQNSNLLIPFYTLTLIITIIKLAILIIFICFVGKCEMRGERRKVSELNIWALGGGLQCTVAISGK